MIILAVVSINAVLGENGIIRQAERARDFQANAEASDNDALDEYAQHIANAMGGEGGSTGGNGGGSDTTPAATIAEAQQESMLTKTVNSDVTDKYNNKITIPAGFKVLVDGTTTYTAETIDVTKGIVITDGTNEFVWIPVGESITNGTKTVPITLGRYSFDSSGVASAYSGSYTEDTAANHNSSYGNAIALDIEAFRTSATQKGGYYLARYEARVINGNLDISEMTNSSTANTPNNNWTGYAAEEGTELKLVSKADAQVWNYVTQKKASELSRNMYTNKPFTSDLINSYAWDTAIVFLQEFDDRTDKTTPYSSKYSLNGSLSNTGTTADKICNIYDMSGNCYEWSTETSSDFGGAAPCVYRGGYYSNDYTSRRVCAGARWATDRNSFRPLLYVAL